MTRKPTKRDRFYAVREFLNACGAPEDMVEFIDGELDRLERKASAPRKPTTAQRENVAIKDNILRYLTGSTDARATDIANALGLSVQKVSALLRQLVTDGAVERVEDGKVVTFRLTA